MNLESLTREEIARKCDNSTWFHSINFGDFQSSGRFEPGTPQNRTLFGSFDILNQIDLTNQTCLDVGSADGIISFGMKAMGARKVVAIDSFDLPTFRMARHLTGEQIEYHPGTQLKDLKTPSSPLTDEFDLALCAGVIYHMLNPLSAFIKLRQSIKTNGILIMETPYYKHSDDAIMVLNSESPNFLKELYTYWVPSRKAVEGMMKLLGFDIIAIRVLESPSRITVVGQAKEDLNQVSMRPEQLIRMHEVDFCDFEFRFKDLGVKSHSSITHSIVEFEKSINAFDFDVQFPYHPGTGEITNPKGKTRWLSKTKNW